jgi:hypothetical protein
MTPLACCDGNGPGTEVSDHSDPNPRPFRSSRFVHVASVFILWLGVCIVGYFLAMRYEFKPGPIGRPRVEWPAESVIVRPARKTTLLTFIHPRCVCTGATVAELIRVIRKNPDTALIAVVFVPANHESDQEWSDGSYIRTIRADIATSQVFLDSNGAEARRFGVSTSGTILVFDQGGREVFRGGITGRRGGEGDNPGIRRLQQVLSEPAHDEPGEQTPVFGCSIESSPATANPENSGGAR